ncbi:uncharacterized protein [Physcomitrium patens]|uniref:uncharacterized protein isoform X1 n=1 Tax=Physcomitrium patens TaxID=3218 RepID=UPI00016234C7
MPVVRSRLPSLVKISGISCEGWLRRGRGASFAGAGDCLYSSLLSHDHSCCTDAVCTFSITLSRNFVLDVTRFGNDEAHNRHFLSCAISAFGENQHVDAVSADVSEPRVLNFSE